LGPESTIEYYRLLINTYRERVRDGSYPAIIITSADVNRLAAWMGASQLQAVADYLVREVRRLADAGSDFGLISANTPHIVFNEVQQRSPIPLISIVEAACAAVSALGIGRVGLLGTRFTMQASFYPEVFVRRQIAVVTPRDDEQNYVHDKYMNELLVGSIVPATRERLLQIIRRMREEQHVEAILLAGTELPLILRQQDSPDVRLLDTAQMHVEAAVARMLS